MLLSSVRSVENLLRAGASHTEPLNSSCVGGIISILQIRKARLVETFKGHTLISDGGVCVCLQVYAQGYSARNSYVPPSVKCFLTRMIVLDDSDSDLAGSLKIPTSQLCSSILNSSFLN